jgi:hypothetical protein
MPALGFVFAHVCSPLVNNALGSAFVPSAPCAFSLASWASVPPRRAGRRCIGCSARRSRHHAPCGGERLSTGPCCPQGNVNAGA